MLRTGAIERRDFQYSMPVYEIRQAVGANEEGRIGSQMSVTDIDEIWFVARSQGKTDIPVYLVAQGMFHGVRFIDLA